jgi:hypothetical protein
LRYTNIACSLVKFASRPEEIEKIRFTATENAYYLKNIGTSSFLKRRKISLYWKITLLNVTKKINTLKWHFIPRPKKNWALQKIVTEQHEMSKFV